MKTNRPRRGQQTKRSLPAGVEVGQRFLLQFDDPRVEATAYQTRDIVEAMNKDSGVELKALKVDGGMVKNELLMQFQSDILDVAVTRPKVAETTALGAAYAAGLAVGVWADHNELKANWHVHTTWEPDMDGEKREELCKGWQKAMDRTLNWKED